MELEWVIGGEGDVEASTEVLREGAAVVVEEEVVVAERRHGNADLSQVVEVLNAGDLDTYREGGRGGREGGREGVEER